MSDMELKKKSVPRFHMRAVEDPVESEKMGHPVFKDVEWIEVMHPGSQNSVPSCRVRQHHIDFYHEAYEAFKRGEEVPLEGFPITEWAPISRAVSETLKGMGVHTVEALADMPLTSAQHMPTNIQSLRIKAQRFLKEHNSEQAQINTLKAENKTLIERLEKLEALSSDKEEESPDVEEKKPRNSNSGKRATIKAKG